MSMPGLNVASEITLRSHPAAVFQEIKAALKRATSVLEAKEIRAKVEAVRRYAKEAGNRDVELLAVQVRLEAERRAGQILIETAGVSRDSGRGARRNRGGRPRNIETGQKLPTLADLGVSNKQSFLWQQVARLPEKTFERILRELSIVVGGLSTPRLLRLAIEPGSKLEVRLRKSGAGAHRGKICRCQCVWCASCIQKRGGAK